MQLCLEDERNANKLHIMKEPIINFKQKDKILIDISKNNDTIEQ